MIEMVELVTRAMYEALTAERDALAAEVKQLADFVEHHQNINGPLVAKVTELTTQLAAAHGLQSRAERAEAQVGLLRKALDIALLPAFQRCSVNYRKGHLSYAGQLNEWHAVIDPALAAVPS